MRIIGVAAAILAAALVLSLAVPMREWRTGDQGLASMDGVPETATPPFSRRVWIDTDAACGHGPRTDPDDCFAIALLARSPGIEIAGISVVAGNAELDQVERTTRELAKALERETGRRLRVYRGHGALSAALAAAPLTLVALGPLSNVAAALEERPQLRARVARVVAVMGRRPGHLFHPAEGARGGAWLGHGPIFRDFNFALDTHAAARVLAMSLPLTLVPYDAARGVAITVADLDRLDASIPWLVQRARGWLEYWRTDMGRLGFFPFDLLAAAYVVDPSAFRCTGVRAEVREDDTLVIPWRPLALLVEADAQGHTLYCAGVRGDPVQLLIDSWAASPSTLGCPAGRTRSCAS